MFDKDYFISELNVVEEQAEDYVKAFRRVLRLITQIDPVFIAWVYSEEYDIEAVEITKNLWRVNTAEEALELVQSVLKQKLNYEGSLPIQVGKELISVKETFIWPKAAY